MIFNSAVENRPILKFFARIFFILVLVLIIGFSAVYYYLEQQNGKYISHQIELSQKELAGALTYSNLNANEKLKGYFEHSRNQIVASNILKLEMRDQNQTVIIEYEKKAVPEHAQYVFQTILLPPSKSLDYVMIPYGDNHFALVYIKKIASLDNYYTVKMIVMLPSDTISVMRDTMRKIIIAVSLILLLVVIGIFPIIYQQYAQINKEKMKLVQSNFETLKTLGNAVALRDSDTYEHNYRVTYYTIKLAQALNVPSEHIPSLIKGAFLHDIGKIGISDTLLLKPSKLNADEFTSIQKHVVFGLKMIDSIDWLDDAKTIIGCHHERYDGKGYPHHLAGEEIPYSARIFAVVDVFDALTSKRPYKFAISLDESLAILREESGTHFDPNIVDVFCDIARSIYDDVHNLDILSFEALLLQSGEPYIPYGESIITKGIG
ncbi:metal dependent phosphohydrolase (plasmid) [Sulfuricurvum kujiense DSM 16994]|uniref:Metal dependent phosphohydrolase n=1 Tax=Sulfuricurvum kujiense (strain ATCC BAA-921 / DSM 16994 / JCM 11577 / YK-1) TaxID=709032 RepID=E4U3P4_SULKY|nr:HD domain-containing phosphohydrolase [Sulfuricurvum kujiense]ADR35310.1 metal dependent phosphohydrolase [Sulfuricurvum kujiense DSM 16994]